MKPQLKMGAYLLVLATYRLPVSSQDNIEKAHKPPAG